jgi:tetratricopeptide (TPR) repeat protein
MLTTVIILLGAAFADSDVVGKTEDTLNNVDTSVSVDTTVSETSSATMPSVNAPEEFIITESLNNQLQGSLKDAFEAYQAGNFALAEKKFSSLAVFQHRVARQRRFVEQGLELERGRLLSSSYGRGYEDAYTPVSAPNAKARAFAQPLPLLQIKRSASKLFYLKGIAQLRQNKNADALKTFERALRIDKFNLEARIEYAISSLEEGDVETAAEELETIDYVAAKYCTSERCIFSDDSIKRHARLRLAYENTLKAG